MFTLSFHSTTGIPSFARAATTSGSGPRPDRSRRWVQPAAIMVGPPVASGVQSSAPAWPENVSCTAQDSRSAPTTAVSATWTMSDHLLSSSIAGVGEHVRHDQSFEADAEAVVGSATPGHKASQKQVIFLRARARQEGAARAVGSSAGRGFLRSLAGVSGQALREPVSLAIHLKDVDLLGCEPICHSLTSPLHSRFPRRATGMRYAQNALYRPYYSL